MLEAWIYAKPLAWDAIAPAEDVAKQSWHYPYQNGITGFWKSYLTDYEVYNVVGTQAALDALVTELGALNVAKVFAWEQGPGFDSLDQWPTVRADVLTVMKDHPGSIAPTYENPNWAHVFLGQAPRIFAGDFNNDFNGDFL